MALSSCSAPLPIEDSSLTDWTVIGSGGFGQVFKARHKKWCFDVAVKLLHYDDGNSESLLHELDMMCRGSSPYVIQVFGVFRGQVPSVCRSLQLGLVMEVMERGSLASLQKTLCEPPPWPLVFSLARQVALGINFLHNLSPALLHLDLKPSNVLLDSYLQAKLTDFGLARSYYSKTSSSRRDDGGGGGTKSYMPPEAFDVSYRPTRASDVYSFGILLWSIVTGKQPYPNPWSAMVELRIPRGDRPSLDEIGSQAARSAELTGLVDLMMRCWAASASERPTARECATVTEELYAKHKHSINDTVHRVLKKLAEKEKQTNAEQIQRDQISPATGTTSERRNDVVDVPTGRPPVQEVVRNGLTANRREATRLRDKTQPAGVCGGDLSRLSDAQKVQSSSVQPIQSLPPGASSGRSSQPAPRLNQDLAQSENDVRLHGAVPGFKDPVHQDVSRCGSGFERQVSSPGTFVRHPPPPAGPTFYFRDSNVTGFQHGNNNNMHIAIARDRRRHPTAPPALHPPRPRSGSKTGRVG